MTWYGNPLVYKKDEIIVIVPRTKEAMLDDLKFEKMFEFFGPLNAVKIKDKRAMFFDDLFGDTRMARLTRIATDLDLPYYKYLDDQKIKKIAKAKDRKERQKMLRKSKIVVTKNGLVIHDEDKTNLACGNPECGRRFLYYHSTPLVGDCPMCYNSIKLFELPDGGYKVTRLYVRR